MYRITRGANTSRKWEWNFPRLRLTGTEKITNKRNKHLVLTTIVLNLISINEKKVLLFILLIWAADKSPLTNVGNSQMNKGCSSEMLKTTLKRSQDPVFWAGLTLFSLLRGTNSYITHDLLSYSCCGHFEVLNTLKPWPNGPASSRKWTQVELA